jgi:hypothetical protein
VPGPGQRVQHVHDQLPLLSHAATTEIGADELTAGLAAVGLEFGSWLTGDQVWFTAHAAR